MTRVFRLPSVASLSQSCWWRESCASCSALESHPRASEIQFQWTEESGAKELPFFSLSLSLSLSLFLFLYLSLSRSVSVTSPIRSPLLPWLCDTAIFSGAPTRPAVSPLPAEKEGAFSPLPVEKSELSLVCGVSTLVLPLLLLCRAAAVRSGAQSHTRAARQADGLFFCSRARPAVNLSWVIIATDLLFSLRRIGAEKETRPRALLPRIRHIWQLSFESKCHGRRAPLWNRGG